MNWVGIDIMTSSYSQGAQGMRQSHQVVTEAPVSAGTIRSVTLKVAGQVITLRTDQSEAYMHNLAGEVNALLESLRSAAPSMGLPQLMAMAALQLADRAVCAEQAVYQENLKLERHIERLNGILRSLDE